MNGDSPVDELNNGIFSKIIDIPTGVGGNSNVIHELTAV